jgi:hypothetical protein
LFSPEVYKSHALDVAHPTGPAGNGRALKPSQPFARPPLYVPQPNYPALLERWIFILEAIEAGELPEICTQTPVT